MVTILPPFGQSLADDLIDLNRETAALRRDRLRLFVQDPVCDHLFVGCLERRALSQHLVQHATQRQNVRPSIDASGFELFRCHVGWRPQHYPLLVTLERPVSEAAKPKSVIFTCPSEVSMMF